MEKPTIQDIFYHFYPDYLNKYSPSLIQMKVASCIINCKTGAYGTNVSICEDCGHLHIHYNSCRNRCCPMYQALPKEKWMDAIREDVLEAPYFHVVFTVPQELNPVIYSNQKLLYDVFYHSVSATINELTAESKYLGAKVGYICILHTWDSEMNFHPHIHVILLGGELTKKHQWKDKGSEFFLPVKVLSKVFRGKYTHQIAISNHHIMQMDENTVTFSVKDYREEDKWKELTLSGIEFIRRFLMHVPPRRFVRIRHYGLLCTRSKSKHLTLCRNLLGCKQYLSRLRSMETPQILETLYGIKISVCTCCDGKLRKSQLKMPLRI